MKNREYLYVIKEDNAPERLRGKTITATVTESKLEFSVNLEEEPTAQEAGYLKWFLGEMVDLMKKRLKEDSGIDSENLFSLPKCRFLEK